jgi:hypothetical protein
MMLQFHVFFLVKKCTCIERYTAHLANAVVVAGCCCQGACGGVGSGQGLKQTDHGGSQDTKPAVGSMAQPATVIDDGTSAHCNATIVSLGRTAVPGNAVNTV